MEGWSSSQLPIDTNSNSTQFQLPRSSRGWAYGHLQQWTLMECVCLTLLLGLLLCSREAGSTSTARRSSSEMRFCSFSHSQAWRRLHTHMHTSWTDYTHAHIMNWLQPCTHHELTTAIIPPTIQTWDKSNQLKSVSLLKFNELNTHFHLLILLCKTLVWRTNVNY